MTEMMTSAFGNPFGMSPPSMHFNTKKKKKDPIVRKDESYEQIMEKMNKLSEEIGERSEKNKNYDF